MRTVFILFFFSVGVSIMAQNKSIQEAMSSYNYETAIALIEKEKPTPALLFQKGKAQKGLSRNAEALRTFKQVIEAEPTNPLPMIEAAECCKTMGKNDEALQYYRLALDLNPESKYVRLQYINLLCTLQQFEEALGESSLLAETDSSTVVLHLVAQSTEGMYPTELDAALGNYHIIQDKYPDDYVAAAKLGSIYNAMKEYSSAIEATEKYRQIDSTNMAVNRQNALAYCLSADYPMATLRYEYLIAHGDKTYLTLYYSGICYYANEDFYAAHDMLEKALPYDPHNINLLYYLGRSCAKTSWKKEGVEYLNLAIELATPQDSAMIRLYKGMVECYKMASKPGKQIESMKEQYKYDKANHRLWYDMAQVYDRSLKDKKSAEQCLEIFLRTKPKEAKEQPAILNTKGEVEADIKNYYNAAENWLNDLRNERKKESFFKDGAPKGS